MGLIIIPKKYKVVYANDPNKNQYEFFDTENLAIARFEELKKEYLYVYQSEIEETVKKTTIR